MTQEITDGLVLMPPLFANGLSVWSRQDGRPGSDTWATAANAGLVAADADFGSCLEIVKTEATTRIRFMGQTPIRPGLYLRVSARVKALSGNLPSVRVAAWAGNASNQQLTTVPQNGPSTALTSYGNVVTVSAIIGTGTRTGVVPHEVNRHTHRHTDRQTHRRTDISTYRKHRPRGPML